MVLWKKPLDGEILSAWKSLVAESQRGWGNENDYITFHVQVNTVSINVGFLIMISFLSGPSY